MHVLKSILAASLVALPLILGCTKNNPSSSNPDNNNNNNNGNQTQPGYGTLSLTVNGSKVPLSVTNANHDSSATIDALRITATGSKPGETDTLSLLFTNPRPGSLQDSSFVLSSFTRYDSSTNVSEKYWASDTNSSATLTSLSPAGASGSFDFIMDTCFTDFDCTSEKAPASGTFNVAFMGY